MLGTQLRLRAIVLQDPPNWTSLLHCDIDFDYALKDGRSELSRLVELYCTQEELDGADNIDYPVVFEKDLVQDNRAHHVGH